MTKNNNRDDFRGQLARLRGRGVSLRLQADAAGLYTRDIVLNQRHTAQIVAGERNFIESLAIGRQRIGVDLSGIRDPLRLATGVQRFVTLFGALTAYRRCWFQIDCDQARHTLVRNVLRFANVNVATDLEARHDFATLEQLESLPGWCSVFSTRVDSACPPLGCERAAAFLPELRLAVPKNAALLVVELDMVRLVRGTRICPEMLAARVRDAVGVADHVFDRVCWPFASLTADAFSNRRIALIPRGLGDALLRCGFGPCDPAAPRWLRQLLRIIRKTAHVESARQARSRGCFPAMRAEQVFSHLSGRADLGFWQQRWEHTVRHCQFRHRHLLYLTLDSLWPSACQADPAFAQLLPVLVEAEGLGFGPDWPNLATDNKGRPKLLRLAGALAQQRIGSGLRLR